MNTIGNHESGGVPSTVPVSGSASVPVFDQYGASQPNPSRPLAPVEGRPAPDPQGAYPGPVPPRPSGGQDARPPLWAPWYGIGFTAAIERFFRKMFVFHGRASRSEYWWTVLFGGLLSFAAMAAVYVVGFAAGVSDVAATAGADSPLDGLADNVGLAIQLLFFIPTISLSVRRLHDQNRSGWWLLLAILPQAGAVVPLFAAGVVNGYTGHDDPVVVVVGVLATVGLYVLGSLASVILMVLPSDPRGARFDRPPVDALAGRAAGAAASAAAGGASA